MIKFAYLLVVFIFLSGCASATTFPKYQVSKLIPIKNFDGVVEIDNSKGLRNFSEEDLKVVDFINFPFFSLESKTIGLLFGAAGASGGGSQEVYFINIHTDDFIKIGLTDMNKMSWIEDNGQNVGYKEYDTSFCFGPNAVSWGCKERLSEIVCFDENSLKNIFNNEFEKINFMEDEKILLKEDIMPEVEYRQLGETC